MKLYLRSVVHLLLVFGVSAALAAAYEDFFIAVNRDDDRTVAQLLAKGFDPNSRDPRGQTALHLALRDKSPRVADAVWKSPALDVNAANAHAETPLMMAALRGDLAWVQRLVERGAKVHLDGWSPIHYAATGPEVKIVALLLQRGALIDTLSPDKSTPLMMAARYGSEASVDLLLARGANAKLRNDIDLSAVELAQQSGRDFLVDRLKKAAER